MMYYMPTKAYVLPVPFSGDATVHGKVLGSNRGRFFIMKLLIHAKEYPQFDHDVHCVGAPIDWPFSCVSTVQCQQQQLLSMVPNYITYFQMP